MRYAVSARYRTPPGFNFVLSLTRAHESVLVQTLLFARSTVQVNSTFCHIQPHAANNPRLNQTQGLRNLGLRRGSDSGVFLRQDMTQCPGGIVMFHKNGRNQIFLNAAVKTSHS